MAELTDSRLLTAVAAPHAPHAPQSDVPYWSLALLYAATIVGFPLASALPLLLGVDSQVATIPYRAAMLGLVGWIFFRWCLAGARIYAGALLLPVLLLWTLLAARMLWDVFADPMAKPPRVLGPQFAALSIGACFLPALGFLEVPNSATLRLARRLIEAGGAVALLLVLWIGLGAIRGDAVFQRLSTDILNPISLGHLGVSVFVACAFGMAQGRAEGRERRSWVGRTLLRTLILLVAFATVVASFSRAPIMLLLISGVVLAVVPVNTRRRGRLGAMVRIGLLAGLVTVAGVTAASLQATGVIDVAARFQPGFEDASSRQRLQYFDGAWQQFLDRPLTGDRYLERQSMTYPHNAVLESMMSAGIVGLVLTLLINFAGLWVGVQLVFGRSEVVWIGLLYFQYAVGQMVSGSMLLNASFWAFFLAGLAVYSVRHEFLDAVPTAGTHNTNARAEVV